MKFTDIFKGKYLIALIGAIIICVVLMIFNVNAIVINIITFAFGCNYKGFAEWIDETILRRF